MTSNPRRAAAALTTEGFLPDQHRFVRTADVRYFKHAPTGYWWQQSRRYVTEVKVTPRWDMATLPVVSRDMLT